jgi:RNA-directed DNA polymerase
MIGYENGQIGHRQFTSQDAYHERRRRRAQAELTVDEQFQLKNLMSRDNLYQTALSLKQYAGDSPGPNEIRLSELTPSELGAMAGELARQIRKGTYKPRPRRAVPIEKPTGGTRILRIQDVEDKTVARRLKDALEPLIDSQFVEESFGFRPERGAWQMLARLKTLCDRDGLYALVVCDVRRAFDSVSVQEVMCAFVELMEESKLRQCSEQTLEHLRRLIATVLLGGSNRSVGIDTGCPFSPLALNVLLHMKHDLIS